ELSLVEGEWECTACGRVFQPNQVLVEEDRRRLDEMIARITETHIDVEIDPDRVDTFGHAVVDEAQDLTPMQWRVLRRRVPTGSMTVVGDLGQSKYAWASRSWEDIATQ